MSEAKSLLYKSEFKALVGDNYRNLLFLTIILCVTLVSICFSFGSLNYLNERMNDPYTNWVNLKLPRYLDKDSYIKLKESISSPESKDKFNLKGYEEYVTFRESFVLIGDESGTRLKGRTLELGTPLTNKILEKANLLGNVKEIFPNSCGVIVKSEMLEKLNYKSPREQNVIQLLFDSINVHFEILGVVKDLPDKCDFAVLPGLYNLLSHSVSESNIISTLHEVNKIDVFSEKEIKEEEIREMIKPFGIRKIRAKEEDYNNNYKSFIHTLYFTEYLDRNQLKELQTKLIKYNISTYNKLNCNIKNTQISQPYYISFNFENLLNVKDFSYYLSKDYNLELELSSVESKSNFGIVSLQTLVTILSLLMFGIFSIIYFIASLIANHIKQNSQNLGTLKAFGLKNDELVSIYSKSILKMLLISLFICLAFLVICYVLNVLIYSEIILFNFLNFKIISIISLIIVFSYFISYRIISVQLAKTPGELIFSR